MAALGWAAGCGGDDEAVPLPTTPAAEQATTTASTESTTTTADFETEVKLAALALLELRNEVFMDPDPARVSEYIADTCVCLERERQIVADLAATGRRWTGPAIEPLGITITVNDDVGLVLTVAARQPAGEIIDDAGRSTPVPAVDFAPYRVSLQMDTSTEWRINNVEGISLGQRAFDAIVLEGVP